MRLPEHGVTARGRPPAASASVRIRRPMATAAFLLAMSLSPRAGAFEMSEADYLLLPEYCRAQGNVAPVFFKRFYRADLVAKWQSALGDNYLHYHHLCWAIVSITHAYRLETQYQNRSAASRSAVGNIIYVLERATPDFILAADAYTRMGEGYLLARDDRNAEAAFRKAIEIKPDYWRPYVWWAQRLMQLGRTREALAFAEEGQKNAPNAKAIDDLIRDLRGESRAGRK